MKKLIPALISGAALLALAGCDQYGYYNGYGPGATVGTVGGAVAGGVAGGAIGSGIAGTTGAVHMPGPLLHARPADAAAITRAGHLGGARGEDCGAHDH